MSRTWTEWPVAEGARTLLHPMDPQPFGDPTHAATANGYRSRPRGPWIPCFYLCTADGRGVGKVYGDGSGYLHHPLGPTESLYDERKGYTQIQAPLGGHGARVNLDEEPFVVLGVQPRRIGGRWIWATLLEPERRACTST